MALRNKSTKRYPHCEPHTQPQSRGLYLAISSTADVSDPVARTDSIWQRIKETTSAHWGLGGIQRPKSSACIGLRAPIDHRTTVWFAY